MIIINDDRKLLNLNQTVIYLMVSAEENNAYAEKLKSLNRYTTLTKGLFRFDIVEKGKSPYEQLPQELVHATRQCNVFVRLINSIHGRHSYGLAHVDLAADIKDLVEELKTFVHDVCQEDINHLDILSSRNSSISAEAMAYYKTNQLFSEIFETALHLDTENAEEARKSLENVTDSSDVTTSHELMQGAVNSKLSSMIERVRMEQEEPSVSPKISVAFKRNVLTGRLTPKGRAKTGLGIEITINGESPIPVHFEKGNHLTVLYFLLLMAIQEGRHLRGLDFDESNHSKNFEWIRRKYDLLLLGRDFDTFMNAVNTPSRLHLIVDAKSKVNSQLWEVLGEQYKEAYHYLYIRTTKSRYELKLAREQVFIDPKILPFEQ